jgi:hypothetical protein
MADFRGVLGRKGFAWPIQENRGTKETDRRVINTETGSDCAKETLGSGLYVAGTQL